MNILNEYRKTIAAVVTGLIGWAVVVVESASDSITSGEWIMLATILATALGVYGVANAQPAHEIPTPTPAPPADDVV